MHSGPIQAQGQFYLPRPPTETQAADGTWQYTYHALERFKRADHWCSQPWRLHWSGPAARDFYRAHWQQLRAGAAINVLIDRIHHHTDTQGTVLAARIHSISLAPARHTTTNQPEPATCP